MKIQPFGDSCLLVSFEEEISEATNQKVIGLYNLLQSKPGIRFQIPAYHSLTLGIDEKFWSMHEATIYLRKQIGLVNPALNTEVSKTYVIPVCYDHEFGPDLTTLSDKLCLSTDEIIDLHTSKSYRVFMLGFVAGFAYMGTLDAKLNSPRKASPRLKVPSGSVGLAGLQTGIYPTEAPGGWQIIGRTPLEMFASEREDPTLLQPGDQVRFRSIGKEEYQIIKLKIETGIFEMEVWND